MGYYAKEEAGPIWLGRFYSSLVPNLQNVLNRVHPVSTGQTTQPEADQLMGLVGFRLTPFADPLWPTKVRPPGPLRHREVFGTSPAPRWLGGAAVAWIDVR